MSRSIDRASYSQQIFRSHLSLSVLTPSRQTSSDLFRPLQTSSDHSRSQVRGFGRGQRFFTSSLTLRPTSSFSSHASGLQRPRSDRNVFPSLRFCWCLSVFRRSRLDRNRSCRGNLVGISTFSASPVESSLGRRPNPQLLNSC